MLLGPFLNTVSYNVTELKSVVQKITAAWVKTNRFNKLNLLKNRNRYSFCSMFLFKEIMQLGRENNEIAFARTTSLIPLTRFRLLFPFHSALHYQQNESVLREDKMWTLASYGLNKI